MFKLNRIVLQLMACAASVLLTQFAHAQQAIPLNDLSAFSNKPENWKIVGDAAADLSKENVLTTTPGKGVLANIHAHGTYGAQYELITNLKHGDLDLELDFMLAKGSNSGIYLQGTMKFSFLTAGAKKRPNTTTAAAFTNAGTMQSPKERKAMKDMRPATMWQKHPDCGNILKFLIRLRSLMPAVKRSPTRFFFTSD